MRRTICAKSKLRRTRSDDIRRGQGKVVPLLNEAQSHERVWVGDVQIQESFHQQELQVGGQLHALLYLPTRNSPSCSFDTRQGGLYNRRGRCGERKFLTLPGLRTPTPLSSSPYPVAILTGLSRPHFNLVFMQRSSLEN
jgi:hypothetical protein